MASSYPARSASTRGRDGVRPDAPERRDHDADTVHERVLAEVGAPLPGGDGEERLRGQRVEPHLAVLQEDRRADVAAALVPVRADGLEDGGVDLVRAERDLVERRVDLGALEQPLAVLVEPEDRGTAVGPVGADALEHAVAVVEGRREDVDGRVVPVDELAVHPDLVGLGKGHPGSCRRRVRACCAAAAVSVDP